MVWHFDGRESGDLTAEEEEENWRWRRDIVFRGVLERPVKTRERLAKYKDERYKMTKIPFSFKV